MISNPAHKWGVVTPATSATTKNGTVYKTACSVHARKPDPSGFVLLLAIQ
jgi:hypothetical protein